MVLSDLERAILDLEKSCRGGDKSAAIRALGVSEPRYYLILNGLLDREAALAAEPALVSRLRRLRDERNDVRATRRRQLP